MIIKFHETITRYCHFLQLNAVAESLLEFFQPSKYLYNYNNHIHINNAFQKCTMNTYGNIYSQIYTKHV